MDKKSDRRKNNLILIESQILQILLQNLERNLSLEDKFQLAGLEYKKDKILKEEEFWRLKSRVVWIEFSDSNTRFFHRFASNQRNSNTIWEIKTSEGGSLTNSKDIQLEAVNFFGNLYVDPRKVNISNQMDILKHFPSFFSKEEGVRIGRPINVEEIKEALSSFSKD